MYDVWNKHIATMGSGSDFTAFQDYAGIPSIDIGFTVGPDTAVYHYHSNYDSFAWMDTFGDPGWHYHATMARVWALLAARLVDTPVLQLNATDYAIGLKRYLKTVEDKAHNVTLEGKLDLDSAMDAQGLPFNISFSALHQIIARFHNSTVLLDTEAEALLTTIRENPIPWWRWWERLRFARRVNAVNERLKLLERSFLYDKGLDGRNWFKHVVFAPGRWTGYAGATFPGLIEAVEDGHVGSVFRWMSIVSGVIGKATEGIELPK